MSTKRKQSKEDSINEPKVVALAGQSYSYGQTPAALCRQHFKEIAKRLNMSVEELAKGVLDKSLGDQLCMLRDFYTSKNKETEVVYQPLLELSSVERDNETIPDKSQQKRSKTETATKPSVQEKKKPCVLVFSSDGKPEEKMNKADPMPLNKAMRADKQPLNKQHVVRNTTLSRIESSIEATIAFERMLDPEKEQIDNDRPKTSIQEPKIADLAIDTEEVMPLNASHSNKPVTNETTKEPPIVIEHNKAPVTEEGPQEDLETFLYGKSPTRSKPPPRKKYHRYPPSQSAGETTKSTVFDAFGSPPSSLFCPPGLAFEPQSCSPLSRQRDLLSIAQDIAALQKVVASGKKLSDSVSDTIKFTNLTD